MYVVRPKVNHCSLLLETNNDKQLQNESNRGNLCKTSATRITNAHHNRTNVPTPWTSADSRRETHHLSYASDYSFKDTDALEFVHWIHDASHAEGLLYAWWSVTKATTIFQGDNSMAGVTSAAYDAFQ